METIGPLIGMGLLGVVAGWLSGGLVRRAASMALLALVVFIALELIGYQIAVQHGFTLRDAAHSAVEAARSSKDVVKRLVTFNMPFTVGFALGFVKAMLVAPGG